MMRRRAFIAGLGGAVAWPVIAAGQQATMPSIGFLSGRSHDESARDAAAFRDGLKDMGFVEGQNLAIEYRWAESQSERLPELAADLVRRQVAVIAAVGGNNSAFAAKKATATIPIVFTSGADPVAVGLVGSLNRPGRNATGVSWFASELGPKQLGLCMNWSQTSIAPHSS
jgi:putative ABC transport system substrate-binding protein